jgi:hypothetical protein
MLLKAGMQEEVPIQQFRIKNISLESSIAFLEWHSYINESQN